MTQYRSELPHSPGTLNSKLLPGYTGFIPGIQHEYANTYGVATKKASYDSLHRNTREKETWEKYVRPFEQQTIRTPAEKFFIPGYSGFIAGIGSENLYGKTFGDTTYDAVTEDFHRGQTPSAKARFSTTNKDFFVEPASHGTTGMRPAPDRTSPFTRQRGSKVGKGGGAVDPNDSPLPTLLAERTTRPDPHKPLSDISKTQGKHHIPGYTGFLPGVSSENIYGNTYAGISQKAFERQPAPPSRKHDHVSTRPLPSHIPGYTGFVSKVHSENIYARTYAECTREALEARAQEDEQQQPMSARQRRTQQPEVIASRPLTAPVPQPRFMNRAAEGELDPASADLRSNRNKSHIALDDRSHWGKELFASTTVKDFRGHTPADAPENVFCKYPTPTLLNWPNEYPSYIPL